MPRDLAPAYPPAPWRLTGDGVVVLNLIASGRARSLVPPGLAVLSVAPGHTLGALYLAAYGQGSTLVYRELIVMPALVRLGLRVGAWISHIYVDDARSQAGGREIWGLPKELATFEGDLARGDATVHSTDQVLCRLRLGPSSPRVPLPMLLPAFGCRGLRFVHFHGRGTARLGFARAEVEIPATSAFHALGFTGGPALRLHRMDVRVHAPAGPGAKPPAGRRR